MMQTCMQECVYWRHCHCGDDADLYASVCLLKTLSFCRWCRPVCKCVFIEDTVIVPMMQTCMQECVYLRYCHCANDADLYARVCLLKTLSLCRWCRPVCKSVFIEDTVTVPMMQTCMQECVDWRHCHCADDADLYVSVCLLKTLSLWRWCRPVCKRVFIEDTVTVPMMQTCMQVCVYWRHCHCADDADLYVSVFLLKTLSLWRWCRPVCKCVFIEDTVIVAMMQTCM